VDRLEQYVNGRRRTTAMIVADLARRVAEADT
jgi:hypothetical protein